MFGRSKRIHRVHGYGYPRATAKTKATEPLEGPNVENTWFLIVFICVACGVGVPLSSSMQGPN